MSNNIPNTDRDIPDWVRWLAQDADGSWWGYEVEPHQHHQGWYENEVGRSQLIARESANPDWRQTLIEHIKE